MAERIIKESTLSNIADAIRAKRFTNAKFKPTEMPDAIAAITDGVSISGDEVGIALADGSINGKYINDSIKEIRASAFYTNENLSSIDLPEVETIREDAFYNCRNIAYVNIPKVKTIGKSAFRWNGIKVINMPEVVSIGGGAFNSNNIESLDLPKLTYLGTYGFNSNILKYVNLPQLDLLNEGAFYNCQFLETINIPKVERVERNALYNCKALKVIYLPSVEVIDAQAFNSSGLTDIYVPFGADDYHADYAPWGATNATVHYNYTE